MPVHFHLDERELVDRGLTNYWGYNTLAYFAVETRYAADRSPQGVLREFKNMVRELHKAGLEVILDVVYNHTAEGSEAGPTLSMRGIDNAVYYRLNPDSPRSCLNYTGCGNTVNTEHPRVVQLIMDSLRYWVNEMHVDGFRFDLASALARTRAGVDMAAPLFTAMAQDPVLSQVKLIAEPWDLGAGGYQVGKFPQGWSELNGQFRDDVRRFWKSEEGVSAAFASRFTGSPDLYAPGGRGPCASVNFVTSHDGFTLQDLVSYNHKHNEANGENNRDGDNHHHGWNFGVEGPTDDQKIKNCRERQKRNLMASLLLAQGVPLVTAGDELSRTQRGNNNAYCQDNEISWLHWNLSPEQQDLVEFVRQLIALRQNEPLLRRKQFFRQEKLPNLGGKDLIWYNFESKELLDEHWNGSSLHCLGALLAGEIPDEIDQQGNPLHGDSLFVMINGGAKAVSFSLPGTPDGRSWDLLLDTAKRHWNRRVSQDVDSYDLHARSLAVLRTR